MALFLAHTSAADFWRLVYDPHRAPDAGEPTVPFQEAECSLSALRHSSASWMNGSFLVPENGITHLLAPEASSRSGASSICAHVWGKDVPPGSFFKCRGDLYVASPAFVFLQLARKCSLSQLIAYGDEICGRYAFDYREGRGFRQRKVPLTNPEELASYIDAAAAIPRLPGLTRARKALEHVLPNAESPMEPLVEMLLSLPFRHGGYANVKPRFNVEIPLSSTAAAITRKRTCRADLFYEGPRIDLEFDGKHDHEGPNALDSDRRRTNALEEMGYKVICLTSGQVADWCAFESAALRIAKATGKRVEARNRGPLPQRLQLRDDLFRWNRRYGRP